MIDTQIGMLCSLMYVYASLVEQFTSNLYILCLLNVKNLMQINMKGLDGVQGLIYVGTGCVFRRVALYDNDAPAKKKRPSKTCNCLPKWCCLCCGSRKNKNEKKKKTTQIHALENIDGIEGKESFWQDVFISYHIISYSTRVAT